MDFYENVEIQTINGDVFCISESRVDVEFFHLDTGDIVNADNVVLIKKGNKIDILENFEPTVNLFSHFNGLIQ